jgi:nicotinamidase-related amidase
MNQARSNPETTDDVRQPGIALSHPDDCIPGWRDLLVNDDERAVVERYGKSAGIGKRLALLLIDFQMAYLGRNEPLLGQIDEFPAASGRRGWDALGNAIRVLHACHELHISVYATRVAFDPSERDDVSFASKRRVPGSFALGSPYTLLPEQLKLAPQDVLIAKPAASAFFNTSLDEFLASRQIDSLLVTGLSTSGCVRSTVVDAAARGLRPIVVVDAVADRLQISHRAALIDIWMKYGDLCTTEAFIDFASRRGAPAVTPSSHATTP